MTFRERVEALPVRPIAHISHGANPSLKIHLLPNAGTDRNVRSFEYLAAPAVDQSIVRQCSSFLLSSSCFFTSQLVSFISRPDSRQIAFKNRTPPPCTFYGSGETKFPDKVQAEHCLALLVCDRVFVQIGLNVQVNMIEFRMVNRTHTESNPSRRAVSSQLTTGERT
jgi:hypothetical protein